MAITLGELIAQTRIEDVWSALGGGRLQHLRGRAFWRNSKNSNIQLNKAGFWYDFGAGRRGGILDLIQVILETDRRGAVAWLEDFHGIKLNEQRMTYAESTAAATLAKHRREFRHWLAGRRWLGGAFTRRILEGLDYRERFAFSVADPDREYFIAAGHDLEHENAHITAWIVARLTELPNEHRIAD